MNAKSRSGRAEVLASAQGQQLEALFEAHADFVWRVLRRLGLSSADAEDCAQEVFLVVSKRLADYEERGAARSWLFAIARQVVRQHQRKQVRALPIEDAINVPAMAGDPRAAAERGEGLSLVRKFLEELNEDQAVVFYLTEVEGMTAPDVASSLGVNLNTVYARLRLSRERFEALVERHAARERRLWNR